MYINYVSKDAWFIQARRTGKVIMVTTVGKRQHLLVIWLCLSLTLQQHAAMASGRVLYLKKNCLLRCVPMLRTSNTQHLVLMNLNDVQLCHYACTVGRSPAT